MAQITYGSITVSDLTDGKNANIWTTTVAPTTPNYTFTISNLTGSDDEPREGDIILYDVYRYTISAISATTVLAGNRQSLQGEPGTPGSPGAPGNPGTPGASVTKTETEYYRKLVGGQAPQPSTTGSTTIPEYVDGCTYYTRTVTYLSVGDPVKGEWLEATTLTDQIKDAYEAWIAAGAAEQKAKSIVQDSSGVTVAAGINGADVTPGTTSTYGYNTIMAPTYLGLRYNAINLAKLSTTESTPELQFYFPSFSGSSNTPVQGDKGLTLGVNGMNFYHTGSNTADATLNSNGLTINNGSIILGTTSGTAAGNVTLSNKNFTRSINGTSHNDLRFAIGSKFGVASDGTLYSSGLDSVVSRVDIAETSLGNKVDTSTFNTLSQTVDGNSASITELSTITTNNGLTKTTNITNTVNTVSQTAAGNSSKISSLTNTLGTNADGTTKAGDIVHQVSQIDQDLDGVTTRVSKTEVKLAGQYATSSTGAGTTAKVATITPAVTGWTLYTGATITVKFTNKNTTSTPTLNINSTGAKTIKTYSGGALSADEYKWKAGSTFTFTYNGTNWLMQDSSASVRMNSAETEISQNAEQIALRAKSSDVYTKEQVYTKTQTDSAITQRAGEISLSVAQTEIGKIEVGVRNLLRGTATQDTSFGNFRAQVTETSDKFLGCTVFRSNTAWADIGFEFDKQLADTKKVKAGDTITYSIWAKTDDTAARDIYGVWVTKANGGGDYVSGTKIATLTNTWTQYSKTFEVTAAMIDGSSTRAWATRFECNTSCTSGKYIYWAAPKVELGNKATTWTPAPEDVESYTDIQVSAAKAEIKVTTDGISTEVAKKTDKSAIISTIRQSAETVKIKASQVEIDGTATFNAIKSSTDAAYDVKGAASAAESNAKDYADGAVADKADKSNAVARTQRIYYRKTSSGAPSANKTWLATSGTGYGNWSLKVPQMTSGTTKYPYLYTAVQTQTVAQMAAGNACSCSAVLLDDTTTVIDGGTIITGTVNANAVNASSGTFDTANIPNLNANKITAGDIAAARMKVNSIAAINSLTTGKIDAARINVGQITVGSLSDGSSYSTTSQMNTAIGNAVDGIDVGGRNYIRNTGTFDGWTNCGGGTAGTFNGDGTYTFPSTSADGWTGIRPNNNVSYAYVKDCEVVLSAEVKGTNGQTISVMLNPYRSASATGDRTKYRNVYLTVDGGGVSVKTVTADGTWQKVYAIVTINDAFFSSGSGSGDYFGLRASRFSTNHNSYSIRKIKLEKGNKATDWSPAPEDVQSGIDAARTTATSYITDIDSNNGIRIHSSSTENNSIIINSKGMEVFNGGTTSEHSVAKYGDTARIGKESGSHLTLAPDSMSMSTGTKDVFNLLQKTMYIYWNRNYKGRQFANSTDRHVDSWDTNTTISTWDSITVNYKLNNTSKTKKITSISNGVLVNDEIYVHFNYSGTIITLTYGLGSSAASSDIIKLESAVVYYVTDEKLSQLHTGTYPNTTVSGALRIGNGTSDSNRINIMLVDWSGTGKFKGDILAFCGADSSGGMSLTKAEENIDAFKYEDANGHVYIDAYRVGRIVSLLCNVSKTSSIAPGANLYRLNLTNAHLPKPLGTNTSGTGIYSNNMIIGNVYYNKTVTPNRYEFICRNGGSTAVSTVSVGFTITYICQMDEVSGEIKYMDD